MTKFARIINNVAVDVSDDPKNHFHPDLAAEFKKVPNEVQPGWQLVDKVWTEPKPAPEIIPPKVVDPVNFKLLFTLNERAAINEARAKDAIINDFYSMIEDPRMTSIDLNLQSNKDFIDYLIKKQLINEDRKKEILSIVYK